MRHAFQSIQTRIVVFPCFFVNFMTFGKKEIDSIESIINNK